MIRVAAVGDLHFGLDSAGSLRPHVDSIGERADLLLLAGDLTRVGTPEEAAVLAAELRDVEVPIVAVLGNHDYHSDQTKEVAEVLNAEGIRVLHGESVRLQIAGVSVGVAGVKGFGGGFAGACGTDFGEPEMKAFVGHTRRYADRLEAALAELDTSVKIALMHYAPIPETLEGERLEIYPFLGSYLLAEAVDRAGADLVVHGHAHGGSERGTTPAGIPVRNVALPVLQRPYKVYCFGDECSDDHDPVAVRSTAGVASA